LARPKKPADERLDEKIMVYMTRETRESVQSVSSATEMTESKVVDIALRQWLRQRQGVDNGVGYAKSDVLGGANLTGDLGGADLLFQRPIDQSQDNRVRDIGDLTGPLHRADLVFDGSLDGPEETANLLTVHLTDDERDTLLRVSQREQRPVTQVIVLAVKELVERLSEPPETLKRARYEKVMNQNSEVVRGYVCKHGHTFWVDWVTPTEPRFCPVCGSEKNIKRTWDGPVKRER